MKLLWSTYHGAPFPAVFVHRAAQHGVRLQIMKDFILVVLLATLGGFAFGALHHTRFIRADGQKGFQVKPTNQLTDAGRKAKQGMVVGYTMSFLSIAAMLVISTVSGPIGK